MTDALHLAADILDALGIYGWRAFLVAIITATVAGGIVLMVTRAPLQPAQDDEWDARDRQWHYQPERRVCECEDGRCLPCTIDRHPCDGGAA